MTHGFDDKGRLFDQDGNLNRWWSEDAIDIFHQRANCLISQYGNYKMNEIGGLAIDGTITQGENIADNGGIKQAYRAYDQWLHNHCQSTECLQKEHLDGLNITHRQLFFLNFAQVWCGAMRPEATKSKMKTAVHSPGRFRVIGKLIELFFRKTIHMKYFFTLRYFVEFSGVCKGISMWSEYSNESSEKMQCLVKKNKSNSIYLYIHMYFSHSKNRNTQCI